MTKPISPADRAYAVAELRRIEETLSQLSQWLDGAGETRAAILPEDGWKLMLALQTLVDCDPSGPVGLVHRRIGPVS